jgi:hypothetical protein
MSATAVTRPPRVLLLLAVLLLLLLLVWWSTAVNTRGDLVGCGGAESEARCQLWGG